MADHGSLHRTFHGADSAAGCDIQAPQTELVADLLGIVILSPTDGMTTPAHHELGWLIGLYDVGVAQNSEHRIGNAFARRDVEAAKTFYLGLGIDDIP